ncbi:MAG: hypothetical protein KDJ77_09810, partial [Rhodobiaceae bacterium]|nr:hypothetical protein [Rhodobiaceae bacterium]
RIVVLRGGRIEQVGTPMELFTAPDNLFVAGFIGSPRMNLLAAKVAAVDDTGVAVALDGVAESRIRVPRPNSGLKAGDAVTLGVRPEHFTLCEEGEPADIATAVEFVEHLGSTALMHAPAFPSGSLVVEHHGILSRDPERMRLSVDAENAHLFVGDGRAIR